MAIATETLATVPTRPCAQQPLRSIYGLGKGFKRLSFTAYEYCLGFGDAIEVERQFNELRTQSRRICDRAENEPLEEAIESARSDFWATVHAEWWCEEVGERSNELTRTYQTQPWIGDADLASLIDDAYRGILAPVEVVLDRLKRSFFACLDKQGQGAFQIGHLVELMQCRIEIELQSWHHGPPTRTQHSFSGLRCRSVLLNGLDPRCWYDFWMENVRAWWRDLGLSESVLPQLTDFDNQSFAPTASDFVAAFDAAFDAAARLRAEPEAKAAPRPGRLRLTLDDEASIIRREGFSEHSRVMTGLELKVMDHLINDSDGRLHPNVCDRIWQGDERELPSTGAIETLVSELRKKLRPINVNISDGRGGKLRQLQDIDP